MRADIALMGGGVKGAGSKVFFSEEKKQKTFIRLAAICPERRAPMYKSFLVLFFKKERSFFLP